MLIFLDWKEGPKIHYMYGLKIISSNSNYFYHKTVSIHNLDVKHFR